MAGSAKCGHRLNKAWGEQACRRVRPEARSAGAGTATGGRETGHRTGTRSRECLPVPPLPFRGCETLSGLGRPRRGAHSGAQEESTASTVLAWGLACLQADTPWACVLTAVRGAVVFRGHRLECARRHVHHPHSPPWSLPCIHGTGAACPSTPRPSAFSLELRLGFIIWGDFPQGPPAKSADVPGGKGPGPAHLPQRGGRPLPGASRLPVPAALSWSSTAWCGAGGCPALWDLSPHRPGHPSTLTLPSWTRGVGDTEWGTRHLRLCCQGETPGAPGVPGKGQLKKATPDTQPLAYLQREAREGAWLPGNSLFRGHVLSSRTTLDLVTFWHNPTHRLRLGPPCAKPRKGPPDAPQVCLACEPYYVAKAKIKRPKTSLVT